MGNNFSNLITRMELLVDLQEVRAKRKLAELYETPEVVERYLNEEASILIELEALRK